MTQTIASGTALLSAALPSAAFPRAVLFIRAPIASVRPFDLQFDVYPVVKTASRSVNGQDQGEEPRRRDGRGRDDADHLAEDPRDADSAVSRHRPEIFRP